jgi:hypothetical protein
VTYVVFDLLAHQGCSGNIILCNVTSPGTLDRMTAGLNAFRLMLVRSLDFGRRKHDLGPGQEPAMTRPITMSVRPIDHLEKQEVRFQESGLSDI